MKKTTPEELNTSVEEVKVEEKEIVESTPASETLKTKSKAEMMSATIGAMAALPKQDLVKWFDTTMAQFGHFGDGVPDGASAKNKSTIKAKPSGAGDNRTSLKEDIVEMFSGEELSETFKDKASVIFESAVDLKVNLLIAEKEAELEEAYETALNEEIEEFSSNLIEQLDVYLESVANKWIEDNEVAIESALKTEITEDFLSGLKNLFVEHYFDIPNDKVDIIEALTKKVEDLEEALNETLFENKELKETKIEIEAEKIFDEMSEGLVLTQKEQFKNLAENVEFDGTLEDFKNKLSIIKEAHFKTEKASIINEDTFDTEITTTNASPEIKYFADAISRTVKK